MMMMMMKSFILTISCIQVDDATQLTAFDLHQRVHNRLIFNYLAVILQALLYVSVRNVRMRVHVVLCYGVARVWLKPIITDSACTCCV